MSCVLLPSGGTDQEFVTLGSKVEPRDFFGQVRDDKVPRVPSATRVMC
jgi:hypothetical protein